MKTKELDVNVYNDLLSKASMYDLAKDEIKALINANESLINYYSEHHFYKLANNLSLKNKGCKCALSTMKSVEDTEVYGEYTVISQVNFEKLIDKASKLDNFIKTLDNEISLKNEHIQLYHNLKDKDITCKLMYEYQGMQYIKSILLNIMKDV